MIEHFDRTEREFVAKANDWINQVYYSQSFKVTKFLSPREQHILTTLVNRNHSVEIIFDGGFEHAERKRAIMTSCDLGYELQVAPVTGIKICYPKKRVELTHGQILGSLIALHIDRSWFGDILMEADKDIYVAVCEEYLPFFLTHFEQVGKHPINLTEASIKQLQRKERYEEFEVIVASMRLDILIAAIINASRQTVHDLITQGTVQHNFKNEQNHSKQCKINDLISIRKYGRYKILNQKAITKSGRLVLMVGKTI